jgi:hypothetical protein
MLSARNACAACSTHKRPADVPWHQHVVGCPIRAGALSPNADPADVPSLEPAVSEMFGSVRRGRMRRAAIFWMPRRRQISLSSRPS